MEIVKVINPSLDEYAERANSIAQKYGRMSLIMLNEQDITSETDRNEFTFIMKAVGDQLLHREWEAFANARNPDINISASVEPEVTSGSTVLGVMLRKGRRFDSTRLCRAYRPIVVDMSLSQ